MQEKSRRCVISPTYKNVLQQLTNFFMIILQQKTELPASLISRQPHADGHVVLQELDGFAYRCFLGGLSAPVFCACLFCV